MGYPIPSEARDLSMGDARQTAPHGAPFTVSSEICSIWEPEEFNTNRRRFKGLLGRFLRLAVTNAVKASSSATLVAQLRAPAPSNQQSTISNSGLVSAWSKHLEQRHRIYTRAVDPHRPVKVRPSDPAGCANRADDVAGLDNVLHMHAGLRQVREE